MKLRPYQAEAVEAATNWMRRSIMPGLLELATGAGKSLIVAEIAQWVTRHGGKKVLCLQPSKELTQQNHEKYLAYGMPASIYSASAGAKCLRHPVVYGTPGTVKNKISLFGDAFGAVIIDEAHGMTPTIRYIIERMREKNPRLRVIGMTATPYTMRNGYIYQYDTDGSFIPDDHARDPYFNTLLYRVQTRELINLEYLTPAHADPDISVQYSASGLELNSRGQFDSREVERVFEGKGRLTAQIVADIVEHSRNRMGVMIFAATIQHAKEVMESLPQGDQWARMLGGDINMKKLDREKLINDFKARRFKYIVSVGTLTTGFDAPHVDVIAIMRATESASLLQQIIGRGLRLHDEKGDCLVLDYAENIERHQLHDDLFTPEIRVRGSSGGELKEFTCPDCGFKNKFSSRPNPDEFGVSDDGYFLDLAGNPIPANDEDPPQYMPAHFGRRCTGQVADFAHPGAYIRCHYRWSLKQCEDCGHENDIAARYCEICKAELVDPNEKLQMEFAKVKADPYQISTDDVKFWTAEKGVSQAGNDVLICEYTTEYRTFKMWYTPDSKHPQAKEAWRSINESVFSGHVAPSVDVFMQYLSKGRQPLTVTYHKDRGSKFYRVLAHNRPADKLEIAS